MQRQTLRIGCASGFWGDSEAGAAQLVASGQIDYLVFDFLAEITMSLLARARAKDPALGYATDFVQAVMTPHLKTIHERGIKVISFDSGVRKDGRMMHLNPSSNPLIGEKLVKMTQQAIGDTGEVAILSATAQATNQNIWIDEAKKVLAQPAYKGRIALGPAACRASAGPSSHCAGGCRERVRGRAGRPS